MKNSPWHLQYINATATKQVNQQPHSIQYDDVYFNDQGGLEESRFVFIKHNKLFERWQEKINQNSFTIGETGFGTGINLLTTLHAWQTTKEKPQKLHFISCEKYPLSYQDMVDAHACFPELQSFSQLLLAIWQEFNDVFRCGFHTFQLMDNVILTLAIGDATDCLTQLNACIDAWFLDGFSPKNNPEMWHQDLFSEVNRLSRTGTTLSTFTAASQVSKTLNNAGFKVIKKPGFGKKREMITAVFMQHKDATTNEHQWYPTPKANTQNQSVTILGGGIAGMCLSHYFKKAGYHVTVVDQNPKPMQVASGNHMAMVMPLVTARQSPESIFYLRAFETALNFYHSDEYQAIGVEQILHQNKHKKWAKTIQQAGLPKTLLDFTSGSNAAYYPKAGYVQTDLLSQRLRTTVDQWLATEVNQLLFTEKNKWLLLNQDREAFHSTDLLIIANGIKAQQLMNSNDLYLTAKHGMTTTIKAEINKSLKHIKLAEGYVIPNQNHNQWLCGATFDHLEPEQWYTPAQLHQNHWQRNHLLCHGLNIFDDFNKSQVISGHAAIRATTPDHLPICGPIIDQTKFKSDYNDLNHGRHWQKYPPAKTSSNLYILNGLGSRGFTSAPLLAQYLCAMIVGEPLPLEIDLCKIIHPNRFLYRDLKKAPKS